jgi:hypothetical protein
MIVGPKGIPNLLDVLGSRGEKDLGQLSKEVLRTSQTQIEQGGYDSPIKRLGKIVQDS